MIVIDPGHRYRLYSLDGGQSAELIFVKREGEGYPGNVGCHPGTNIQEVLRACIDRLNYLNGQIRDADTEASAMLIRRAVELLERRAARRHNRPDPTLCGFGVVCAGFCQRCGHVGCVGCSHGVVAESGGKEGK